jgi:hypothetical protein
MKPFKHFLYESSYRPSGRILTRDATLDGPYDGSDNDTAFLERAAREARKIGGSVDTPNGTLCPNCAPFGGTDGGKVLGIVSYRTCYNCDYGQ